MKPCILRKVVYRPADNDRLTWGIVIGQNEGLTLLFIPRRSGAESNSLAICAENVEERLFEDVQVSHFPVEDEDLAGIGHKLASLGGAVCEPTEIKPSDLLD
jgi:hypothetical protein